MSADVDFALPAELPCTMSPEWKVATELRSYDWPREAAPGKASYAEALHDCSAAASLQGMLRLAALCAVMAERAAA